MEVQKSGRGPRFLSQLMAWLLHIEVEKVFHCKHYNSAPVFALYLLRCQCIRKPFSANVSLRGRGDQRRLPLWERRHFDSFQVSGQINLLHCTATQAVAELMLNNSYIIGFAVIVSAAKAYW